MTEWQPIETAPKDGRKLLLAAGKEIIIGDWMPDKRKEWKEMRTGTETEETIIRRLEEVDYSGWHISGTDYSLFPATHWMPLPEPPK